MTKSKKVSKSKINNYTQLMDAGALISALWFVYSVVDYSRNSLSEDSTMPVFYGLVVSVVLLVLGLTQQKKLSLWSVATIAVLATTSVIWFFAMSTQTTY